MPDHDLPRDDDLVVHLIAHRAGLLVLRTPKGGKCSGHGVPFQFQAFRVSMVLGFRV